MKRFAALFLIFTLSCCFLCGCREDKELTAFNENMTSFYENITSIGSAMDAIDPSSENAVDSMNSCLENMLKEFQFLASMEIPSQFASVEDLADDALEYMQEAVRLYAEAYEEDYVSDPFIQAAGENYESAMKRVNYIATLLQGEIPEGARIIESDGIEFEPYTE